MLSTGLLANDEFPVKITSSLPYLEIMHNGKPLRIQRNQDTENMVDLDFAITSRACPPFCIQPAVVAPGVETLGELELLAYIRQRSEGDDSIVIIDSRTGEWLSKGMIPMAVNVPWTALHDAGDTLDSLDDLLPERFNVKMDDKGWDFSEAKTAVFYCNGPWCGQSPVSIRKLLKLGYPAEKIKWYRMGMQGWKMLGLTTVVPEE